MKRIPKTLVEKIMAAQIAYHITGGEIENEYHVQGNSTTTGISYTATRDHSERGLSYIIRKEKISIAGGHKQEYMGRTSPWSRETVEII